MAELVDPTQKGNYPVVLGDSLLRKNSNEIFTGVRYNQKPPNSTADQNLARLKPSVPGRTTSYDLNFLDKDGRTDYAYAGARNTDDGQYVLYFDPEREVFVLDRIDSTFNMNITRTPANSDPESLRHKHPHIDREGKTAQPSASSAESSKKSETQPKANAGAKSPPRKKDPPSRKAETKKAESKPKPKPKPKPKAAPTSAPASKVKGIGLALPQQAPPEPPKPKPKPRKLEEEEEDDDDDDDGGLLVEYPGADPRTQKRDFSPAFHAVQRFDEFMDRRESEADDADGESEDEMETDLKAPSPTSYNNHQHEGYRGDAMEQDIDSPPSAVEDDDEEEVEMEDVQGHGGEQEQPAQYTAVSDPEDDLEKDLFEALEAEKSESEISEED